MTESRFMVNPEWENPDEWVEMAGHDLNSATILFNENGYPDIIIYHCHQCVEKTIKAILIKQNTPFEKTHKLDLLIQLVKHNLFDKFKDDILYLDGFRTKTRYPFGDTISTKQAGQCVTICRKIYEAVKPMFIKR